MRAAYRALSGVTVTPEMTDAVRRFHLEEYSPAVAKRLSVAPAEGWSLPTSPEEWYLHYHYLVQAPRPYGPSRVLESSTDTSTVRRRAEGGAAEAGAVPEAVRVRQRPPRRRRDPGGLLQLRGLDDRRHEPGQGTVRVEQRRCARPRPQPVERDRRLPRGRLRAVPADARRPDGVHRLARVRRPARDRGHAAAVPDRRRSRTRCPAGASGKRRGSARPARHTCSGRT